MAAVTINYALKILPWGTVVVERKLQNSLTKRALATHPRMVLCRSGRISTQATSPCGFGWVTTAVPLCWLCSNVVLAVELCQGSCIQGRVGFQMAPAIISDGHYP